MAHGTGVKNGGDTLTKTLNKWSIVKLLIEMLPLLALGFILIDIGLMVADEVDMRLSHVTFGGVIILTMKFFASLITGTIWTDESYLWMSDFVPLGAVLIVWMGYVVFFLRHNNKVCKKLPFNPVIVSLLISTIAVVIVRL